MADTILYKERGQEIFIRAQGHIRAALCMGLKDRVYTRLSAGGPVSLIVDLSSCSYMDSTFLGLLVGFRKALKQIPGSGISLHGPDQTCRDLLKSVGILGIVPVSDEVPEFPPFLEDMGQQDAPSADFILDVHEDLMELSEENRRRFAGLQAVLKKKIEEDKGGST